MEGVAELNHNFRLPQNLYQTYYTEVSFPLWDQYDGLSVTLLHEVELLDVNPLPSQRFDNVTTNRII